MTNWKSLVGFFMFIIVYAYSVYINMSADVISVTGTVAVISLLAIMGRSEQLVAILKTLADAIKTKWGK